MRLLAVVALVIVCAACASQRSGSVDDRAARLESQVWSPYCAGRLLSDCTTQQATELRAEIADRLRQGQTSDEVLAWLRENYGDEVLARPQPGRAGLAAWAVPGAAIVAGAVLVIGLIRRWTHPAPLPPAAPDEPGEDDLTPWIAKVREEVERDL